MIAYTRMHFVCYDDIFLFWKLIVVIAVYTGHTIQVPGKDMF